MEVSSRSWRNAALTAVGILGALTLVAIASRGSTSSGDGRTRPLNNTLLDVLFSLYVIALVLGGLLFLYLLALRRHSRSGGEVGLRRIWRDAITGVVLLALGVFLARRLGTADLGATPVTAPDVSGGGGLLPVTEPTGQEYEPEFAWIPVGIMLALLSVAALGVWWSARTRRRARGELRGRLLADDFAAAVDDSLDDLRAEPDPRRAVIAAYARLERVLAAYGLPRGASDAPLEYLNRMLALLSVRPQAARKLTVLFERAKFSQHAVGPEMKEQAIEALETVRDDLAVARALAQRERAAALASMRERATG
jgi:hypothetical protein